MLCLCLTFADSLSGPMSTHSLCFSPPGTIVIPWYLQGIGSRDPHPTPQDTKICRCSSPSHHMAQHLHTTFLCMQTTAGHGHTSLHSHGRGVVLGRWPIQGLLLGIFWDFFSPIFLICSWLVPKMQNLWIQRADCMLPRLPCLLTPTSSGQQRPWQERGQQGVGRPSPPSPLLCIVSPNAAAASHSPWR